MHRLLPHEVIADHLHILSWLLWIMICHWLHSQTFNLARYSTVCVSLQDMVLDLSDSDLAETMCHVYHCHSDDKHLTD